MILWDTLIEELEKKKCLKCKRVMSFLNRDCCRCAYEYMKKIAERNKEDEPV